MKRKLQCMFMCFLMTISVISLSTVTVSAVWSTNIDGSATFVSGWNTEFVDRNAQTPAVARAILTGQTKHSGNSSIQLDRYSIGEGRGYLIMSPPGGAVFPISAGEKFRARFWYKTDGQGSETKSLKFRPKSTPNKEFYFAVNNTVTDWTEGIYNFTAHDVDVSQTGNAAVRIIWDHTDGGWGTIWIDDFIVEKINDSGDVLATLYTDGFESEALDTTLRTVNVTEPSAVGTGNDELTLSWTNPAKPSAPSELMQYNFGGTKIYRVYDDNTESTEPVAATWGEVNSAVIKGLEPGTTYKFRIRSYDVVGNLTGGVVAVGTTLGGSVTCLRFKKDNISSPELTKIESEGTIIAEAMIENQYIEPATFTLVMVLFKDGDMEHVDVQHPSVNQTTPNNPASVTASLVVPDLDTGEYSVKAFAWDSLNNLKPITGCLEMNETEIKYLPFKPPTTKSVSNMEDLSLWTKSPEVDRITLVPETVKKAEGFQSLKVTFTPNTAAGDDQWDDIRVTFPVGSNPDLSQATQLLYDIYPTTQTTGSTEPLALVMVNLENTGGAGRMELQLPRLIANSWNTISVDISGMNQRSALSIIRFYTYNKYASLEGRESITYYIDNIRVK